MKKNPPADYYQTNWNYYYKSVNDNTALIPWDVAPEIAVKKDLERISPYMDKYLPLIDIGCGIGTQTAYLANHFKFVTGIDISEEAIQIASCRQKSSSNLVFKTLNILDTGQCEKYYRKHGDSNLYMRGTLQQIFTDDRTDFLNSVKLLLGKKGVLYLIELSTKAKTFFFNLYKTSGGFPDSLNRVLTQKITQLIGVHIDELTTIFPSDNFHILTCGEDSISLKVGEQDVLGVPATYAIVQNKIG